MSAAQHTPGPWKIGHMGDAERFWIGQDWDRAIVAHVDRALEADARLIAAAPDLLEALRAMTHGLPDLLESIGYTDEEGMIDLALAAIAKAEGAA